jgi:hypothetical protein
VPVVTRAKVSGTLPGGGALRDVLLPPERVPATGAPTRQRQQGPRVPPPGHRNPRRKCLGEDGRKVI